MEVSSVVSSQFYLSLPSQKHFSLFRVQEMSGQGSEAQGGIFGAVCPVQCQELDSIIPVGPFHLGIFHDFYHYPSLLDVLTCVSVLFTSEGAPVLCKKSIYNRNHPDPSFISRKTCPWGKGDGRLLQELARNSSKTKKSDSF